MALLQHWTYGGKCCWERRWGRRSSGRGCCRYYLAGVVFYLWRDRIILRGWLAVMALGMILVGCWLFPLEWRCCFLLLEVTCFSGWRYTPLVALAEGSQVWRFLVRDLSLCVSRWSRLIDAGCAWAYGKTGGAVCTVRRRLTMLCALGSWYGVERWFLQPVRQRKSLVDAVAG